MFRQKTFLKNLQEAHHFFEKHQILNSGKPFIRITIQPAMAESVFLQLQLDNETVTWHRITWLGPFNAETLFALIDTENDSELLVTLCHETGSIRPEEIQHILDFMSILTVRPSLEPPDCFITDSTTYTLTIGEARNHITWKWEFFPEANKELQRLAGMLEELNERI